MKRLVLIVVCLAAGGLGTFLGQSLLQGQGPAEPLVPRELTSYRDVVKKVLPAVVSIEALSSAGPRRLARFVDDDNFDRVGFGSGFLISPKGVVVTNNHVVENADRVQVQLLDGRKFTSRVIRTDAKTDLAIIQLEVKQPLPYLEFGDSNKMEIGDRVLAVGAPFGLTGTVTHGILSSKGRSLRMNMYEDFLQTDAAINPGNSGGPLVNLEGKVIGINSAIKSRSGGFQGIGLAISSNLGQSIVKQLLETGVVRRGYLGVGIRDVDAEVAEQYNLGQIRGVQVTRVYPNAPSDKAGLKVDDVIVKLGNRPIKDSRDLQLVVASLPIGKEVDLEVIREGKLVSLKVAIAEQPSDLGSVGRSDPADFPRQAILIEKLGLALLDLTPEIAESLGYPETLRGPIVARLNRRGLAAAAGVQVGMVIVSVNGKPTPTAQSAAAALEAASTTQGIRLQVRGPRTGLLTIIIQEEE